MTDNQAVSWLLENSSSITALLGTRSDGGPAVFHGTIPEGESAKPCVVYFKSGKTREAANWLRKSIFTVNIYSSSISSGELIAERMVELFNLGKGDANGFNIQKINVTILGSVLDTDSKITTLDMELQFSEEEN